MTQEVGETTSEIIRDDEKAIEKILCEQKNIRDLYWIVIFATPAKVCVNGKATLMKVIKPFFKKPRSMVGMIIGEVDNKLGNIKWEVNMPDKPFGFEKLGLEQEGHHVYHTSIPSAYAYN